MIKKKKDIKIEIPKHKTSNHLKDIENLLNKLK